MAPRLSVLSHWAALGPNHLKSIKKKQLSNLLVYWFQGYGFTYPTLQMTKTCQKRSLFDDKNNVFRMVLGFRNSGFCGLGLHLS